MQDSIIQCIEDLERQILDVEASGQNAGDAVDALGLSNMKLSSVSIIAILDMLKDGITPPNQDIITSMLGIVEAQKKFLFAMAGLLDGSAEALAKIDSSASSTFVEETEEDSARVFEEPDAKEIQAEEAKAKEAPKGEAKPEAAKAKPEAKSAASAISSIRVPTDSLDRVIELVGKLMVTYAVIAQGGATNMNQVASSLRELDNVISKLQHEVNAIRLVPLKQIFMPMHRLVNSLSQKIGKKLDFKVKGDELALDKTIVESLNEPLVHLLRNAVDHGLEDPEGRKAAGKDETGTVMLSAWRKGDHAFIQVRDDGRGLDPDKILAKAIEKGLADESETYDDPKEILQFVLQSGFSTAEKITDVSGRGVGMDAVVNAIKVTLDGDVEIESELGHGAAFTIAIPLDRSANEGIVDALVCKVGGDTFIMPSRDVVEIYMPRLNEVVELPDGRETVDVRGEVHSLLRLGELLDLEPEVKDIEMAQAIVVRVGDYKGAILVDEVLRQQQVVITGFTVPVEELFHVPIMGYGMMGESDALVIDTEEMINHFQERIAARADASLTE